MFSLMWCELIAHFFIMVRFYRSSKMPSGWREHKKIKKTGYTYEKAINAIYSRDRVTKLSK